MSDSTSTSDTQSEPSSTSDKRPAPPDETETSPPIREGRTTLFDDGQGDFRIMVIRDDGSFSFLPEVPGFGSYRRAVTWIKNSGDQLKNFQLAVVRFCDFVAVQVTQNPKVEMAFKARIKR